MNSFKEVIMLKVNERYKEIVEDLRNRNKTKKGNYTTAEIREIVNDILKASDIDTQNYRSSIPIVKISKKFGIVPYYAKDICVSGMLLINGTTEKEYGEKQVIVIRKEDDLYLQRFVIAYQLGCFLFNYLGSEYDDGNTLFKEEYQQFNYFSKEEEAQISIFAEEILMPEKMLYKQYFISSECFWIRVRGLWNIAIKEYLSEYFEVDRSLVIKHINQLRQ